jgi:16S rRNA processing protein RimM
LSAEFYLVGRVRRAHGIRGELVVESLTDAPAAVFAAGRRVFAGTRTGDIAPDRQELHVHHATPFKGGWIIGFEGIGDRTTAEGWRDRFLLLPENEVDPPNEDELFVHDLVGMRVVRVGGDEIGEVSEIFELPQGYVMEVRRPGRSAVMLPYDDHTVRAVDAEQRVIEVDPVEGLVD